jgi:hypothetical protein
MKEKHESKPEKINRRSEFLVMDAVFFNDVCWTLLALYKELAKIDTHDTN